MDQVRKLTTKEKALRLNLDETIYGSFAEIGAGQEVAANFFKAGGASGTVAKTMSAYDMAFSDAIYGPCERYVCEDRLIQMLDKEYKLLSKRLPNRVENTRFFAFADTVVALNYQKTNKGHGWLGLRFQTEAKGPYNDCIIHVVMHDNDNLMQQQALGVVGVNLIYACYFQYHDPIEIVNSLRDNLSHSRIEVDMFRISGPDFKNVDNRLLSLQLVKSGMTRVAMFGPDGTILQPSEAIYKKNVLLLRGRFRPVTHVSIDMFRGGYDKFIQETRVKKENIVPVAELTLKDLTDDGKIDDRDFLHRVDLISSIGHNVLISNYHEYYRLVNWIQRYTRKELVGIVVGINNLESIFDEKYYEEITGGILEAFGVLFGGNIKIFAYPALDKDSGKLKTLENLEIAPHLQHLFQFLKSNGKIEDVEVFDPKILEIISDNVLRSIRKGEDGWEQYVPEIIANAIKENCLFDYPCSIEDQQKMKEQAVVKLKISE